MPINNTSFDYRNRNKITEQFNQQRSVNSPEFNKHAGQSPKLSSYSHEKQSRVVNKLAEHPGNVSQHQKAQTILGLLTTVSNMTLPAPPPERILPDRQKEPRTSGHALMLAGEAKSQIPKICGYPEADNVRSSGVDTKSTKPLLFATGLTAARRPLSATLVRAVGLFLVGAGVTAGTTYLGHRYFSGGPDKTPEPLASPLSGTVENTSDFISLKNSLESNLAAVVTDEYGHLHVQSSGDRLRTLHHIHGDTPSFIAAARTLLQADGLLHLLDQLLSPPPQGERPMAPRLARETPENVHSRHVRAATGVNTAAPPLAPDTAELALLNSLITLPPEDLAQNENCYFTAWRDSLPRSETLGWLRNAPEDRQITYKKLIDHIATNEAQLASASRTALAEHPGAAELIQRLRRLHLPGRPEDIRLNATFTVQAGALSAPVTLSLTLEEAWQTGTLDKMLASADLKVDVLPQRRLLKGNTLAAFRTGLCDITAPPDAATLNRDDRIRLAFRHLTEARFERSTLEAELKGDLRSNDHIRGLQIVNKFRSGATDIKAGKLTFSAFDPRGRAFSTPLSGWLVLRDNEGSCVLYDADVSARSHYFTSEEAMLQFVSEKAMRDKVATGRLEAAIMAEGTGEASHLSEFFHDLEANPAIWSSRKATLIFTPEQNATFDAAMSAFADRLQARNTAIQGYDASIRDAAVRVVSLNGNWVHAMRQYGMPSLIEYTRAWMKTRDEYGKFLQVKQIIGNAKDFDPDALVIRPPRGKNTGTLTEYAAFLRRRESGSADFATNMEILPVAVSDDAYVSALTRAEKTTFAAALSRAINTPIGAKPATADERYIATLEPDSQRALHTNMQMYARLNQQDVKNGIDHALRAGYPGTDYQQHLREKTNFNLPQNRKLRDAWNMAEVANMQLALKTAQKSSVLPASDAQRIERLLAGFPASATSGNDFMAPLTVGNVRLPGMVMFSLSDSMIPRNGARFRPRQYVYSPEAIHGRHLFTVSEFNGLIKHSPAARNIVAARAALADAGKLNDSFEAMLIGISPKGARAGYVRVDNYDLYKELVERRIADVDEQTISRWEVIRDSIMTGVGAMALPACLASGPAAVVMCAGLTAGSLVNDGYEAVDQWSRGERGSALLTGLLGSLDVTSITSGVKAAGRAAGIGRGLRYASKKIPEVLKGVAGGAQGMLNRLSLKAFGSVADAADTAARHSGAFDAGWLKREWAVNVDLSNARRATPPGEPAGAFYEQNGRMYIRERGYAGEAPMVYEVRAENGGAVRVVSSAHPEVPADRIRWNGIHWVKDSLGLKGGEPMKDSILQSELQKKQQLFEKETLKDLACDTKAQRVLKLLQKDKALWNNLEGKVEVRVIKVKLNTPNDNIVLHPKDENEMRWSGSYHVYITVNINNERMVIDPYVGGPDSCAKVSEKDFIEQHWLGQEGKDYEIKNLAPHEETVMGGDPNDTNDLVTYTVEDFIDNRDIYDPEYYPSHQFYYSKTSE